MRDQCLKNEETYSSQSASEKKIIPVVMPALLLLHASIFCKATSPYTVQLKLFAESENNKLVARIMTLIFTTNVPCQHEKFLSAKRAFNVFHWYSCEALSSNSFCSPFYRRLKARLLCNPPAWIAFNPFLVSYLRAYVTVNFWGCNKAPTSVHYIILSNRQLQEEVYADQTSCSVI